MGAGRGQTKLSFGCETNIMGWNLVTCSVEIRGTAYFGEKGDILVRLLLQITFLNVLT